MSSQSSWPSGPAPQCGPLWGYRKDDISFWALLEARGLSCEDGDQGRYFVQAMLWKMTDSTLGTIPHLSLWWPVLLLLSDSELGKEPLSSVSLGILEGTSVAG